jgi:hypothetical protein
VQAFASLLSRVEKTFYSRFLSELVSVNNTSIGKNCFLLLNDKKFCKNLLV